MTNAAPVQTGAAFFAVFWENRLPCAKGKRSAVAVVNDSPVGCQSRDRVARRQLSAELTEGLLDRKVNIFTNPFKILHNLIIWYANDGNVILMQIGGALFILFHL
jgi:hypothetical protein